MKKIFESGYAGEFDSAYAVIVFELEEDEYFELSEMSHRELCERMNVFDESGYYVTPGASFRRYSFEFPSPRHMVMTENLAYNV